MKPKTLKTLKALKEITLTESYEGQSSSSCSGHYFLHVDTLKEEDPYVEEDIVLELVKFDEEKMEITFKVKVENGISQTLRWRCFGSFENIA